MKTIRLDVALLSALMPRSTCAHDGCQFRACLRSPSLGRPLSKTGHIQAELVPISKKIVVSSLADHVRVCRGAHGHDTILMMTSAFEIRHRALTCTSQVTLSAGIYAPYTPIRMHFCIDTTMIRST